MSVCLQVYLRLHIWKKTTIKNVVAQEEDALNLINCLQLLSCIVGNVGSRFWKGKKKCLEQKGWYLSLCALNLIIRVQAQHAQYGIAFMYSHILIGVMGRGLWPNKQYSGYTVMTFETYQHKLLNKSSYNLEHIFRLRLGLSLPNNFEPKQ